VLAFSSFLFSPFLFLFSCVCGRSSWNLSRCWILSFFFLFFFFFFFFLFSLPLNEAQDSGGSYWSKDQTLFSSSFFFLPSSPSVPLPAAFAGRAPGKGRGGKFYLFFLFFLFPFSFFLMFISDCLKDLQSKGNVTPLPLPFFSRVAVGRGGKKKAIFSFFILLSPSLHPVFKKRPAIHGGVRWG